MEGQSQTYWNNHHKTYQPQHQGDSRSGFQGDAIEFGQDQDCYDLHASSDAWDLKDAPEADEPENDDDVGQIQAGSSRKRPEDAIEASSDHHPFNDGIADQKEGKGRASSTLHALAKGGKEGLGTREHGGGQEGQGFE